MRIQKTLYKLLKDLDNHLFLLKISIENHSRHPAFFILMANELRTLVCKGKDHEDILPMLIKIFNFDTNPLMDENKTFSNFLHEKANVLKQKRYSNLEIIKIMVNSSGEFNHVRKDADPRFVMGKQFSINGLPILNMKLLIIAKDVLHIGEGFMKHIKNLSKSELNEINKKYIKLLKDSTLNKNR